MNAQTKKRSLGQFFTKQNTWLRPQITQFIKSSGAKIAYDPFAGNGDLLGIAQSFGLKKVFGLDIDPALGWKKNDSLISIPKIHKSIIITNPPYLTNYSAQRKKIYDKVSQYFEACNYDDLYQLALEKCLTNDYGVVIIPETFINSSFPKNRLVSITILEDNPFDDTETPVCVVCFDNKLKSLDKVSVYKNDKLLGTLGYFEKFRIAPNNSIDIKFNIVNGKIGLRAVDTTDPHRPISFMPKNELDYDLKGIKHSSRLITIIDMPTNKHGMHYIIKKSNQILTEFRKKTHDVLLSPFKGNKKNGERRRRLDYATARAILEQAVSNERLF